MNTPPIQEKRPSMTSRGPKNDDDKTTEEVVTIASESTTLSMAQQFKTWDVENLEAGGFLINKLLREKRGDTGLPPIVNAAERSEKPNIKRPAVIECLLRRKGKMIIAAPSKARKTWNLMQLAVSAANGRDWIGFTTIKTRVLYINFELYEDTERDRFEKIICDKWHKYGDEVASLKENLLRDLDCWSLRGYATDFETLVPQIIEATKNRKYGLIIIDPVYKILGNADENRATDITRLMNALDLIPKETGAALVMSHHYSKGNKAGVQDGDRGSGSGVFLRDPEALLEFNEHEDSEDGNIFSVSIKLREFKPLKKFCVEYTDEHGFARSFHDPLKLKDGKRRDKYAESDVLDPLKEAGEEGYTSGEWEDSVIGATKMSRDTFLKYKDTLVKDGKVDVISAGKKNGRGDRYIYVDPELN